MKLSFWTIIIMAASVAFGILSFAWFHQYVPTMQAVENYKTFRTQLETEAGKTRLVQKRVADATRLVQQKADIWNGFVATRTPLPDVAQGGINLNVDPYQLSVDTLKFRNSVQRAVNAQVKKGGVTVVNGPDVPAPQDTDNVDGLLATYYNFGTMKFPVVIFDFGQITVQGTYQQIMANVRSYKTMPRYLAVADGLQITGTSPLLTGTYNLTVVGLIRGKAIFPEVSLASAGTSTTGGGGMPSFPGAGGGRPNFGPGPGGPGAPGAPGPMSAPGRMPNPAGAEK